ncbi:MAG: hypothetical protein IPL80_11420 [Sterolibacteriaceae bacterium]|nr:hypothetical protein [Sterolibacteriaceae bacterium]
MGRLLILILLVVAAWYFFKYVAGPSKGRRSDRGDAVPAQEQMLACGYCGLHVPESEGIRIGDAFYCCEAHGRQANGPHDG